MTNPWEEFVAQYRLQKKICAYCEKEELKQTYDQYLEYGNMCTKCRSKINDNYINMIKGERIERLKAKEVRLEELGQQLEHTLGEDERFEIVEEMQKLHKEIRHTKVDLELI